MADYYFHYTSRANAQSIIATGEIRPPRTGAYIFLTDQFYPRGAEAADACGVGDKCIEVCFIVPQNRIGSLRAIGPAGTYVDPRTGQATRKGGSPEYVTSSVIGLDSEVHPISLESP